MNKTVQVTQCKVHVMDAKASPRVRGYANIVLNDSFAVSDLVIIHGDRRGLFVSMPRHRARSGEFFDICNPINKETREHIEHVVLGEYQKALSNPTK